MLTKKIEDQKSKVVDKIERELMNILGIFEDLISKKPVVLSNTSKKIRGSALRFPDCRTKRFSLEGRNPKLSKA